MVLGLKLVSLCSVGSGVLANLAWQIALGRMGFLAKGLRLWVCLWLWICACEFVYGYGFVDVGFFMEMGLRLWVCVALG